MTRIILTFGLIAGAIMAGTFLVLLPFHDQMIEAGVVVGYASMVAAFLLIFFGVRRYRDTVGGGSVSFGRAFQVGILIGLVASTLYVATWEIIYFSGNAPGFIDKYQTAELEKMRAAGSTPAEIAAKEVEFKALLMSLLTAGVLRRRRAVE